MGKVLTSLPLVNLRNSLSPNSLIAIPNPVVAMVVSKSGPSPTPRSTNSSSSQPTHTKQRLRLAKLNLQLEKSTLSPPKPSKIRTSTLLNPPSPLDQLASLSTLPTTTSKVTLEVSSTPRNAVTTSIMPLPLLVTEVRTVLNILSSE